MMNKEDFEEFVKGTTVKVLTIVVSLITGMVAATLIMFALTILKLTYVN